MMKVWENYCQRLTLGAVFSVLRLRQKKWS
jgi:hypothetical protein